MIKCILKIIQSWGWNKCPEDDDKIVKLIMLWDIVEDNPLEEAMDVSKD